MQHAAFAAGAIGYETVPFGRWPRPHDRELTKCRKWGTCADEFQAVQDAFEENFQINGEVGAGLSVYLDGEQVVNLTGGVKNLEGEQYDENTLQMVFSTTKGAAAMCVHHLADQGKIDFDRPVTTYWPGVRSGGQRRHNRPPIAESPSGPRRNVDGVMSLDEALD